MQALRHLLTEATARGAKSTALHALQWVLGILLAAIAGLTYAAAPTWLLVSAGIAAALVLCVFLGSYLYLLFRNPDALRSERFFLSKLAIEKGLVGDNLTGLFEPSKRLPMGLNQSVTASDGQEQQP